MGIEKVERCVNSGIVRFSVLNSVTLTLEELLILSDGFGVLGDKCIEVKLPSLLEVTCMVYTTICLHTTCLDLQ